MLIDTHCHVHVNAFKDDMDEVIKRALASGVKMITVGTQRDTSASGLLVAEKYEGVWASVGLHPNHVCDPEFLDPNELEHPVHGETFDPGYYRKLALHPKCVAIGECGLDYYRLPEGGDHALMKRKQEEALRAHFDLATELGKPVIIHCRDAHAEQTKIIREYVEAGKLARRGVIHCFTGTLDEARAYIELGFYISFTGIITFPPRKDEGEVSPLQQTVKGISIDRILIETDAPYLTPIPFRGKRNEPAHVKFVAEKIAQLKGMTMEEVAKITTENAQQLFDLN